MAESTCTSCGRELPEELGQHADDLVSGLVTCPHCGARSSLRQTAGAASGDVERAQAAPPGRVESAGTFSGQETMGELAEELGDKPT